MRLLKIQQHRIIYCGNGAWDVPYDAMGYARKMSETMPYSM